MRTLYLTLVLAAGSCLPSVGAQPEFVLAPAAAGERLTWSGHTPLYFDEPFLEHDEILDDVESEEFSLALRWSTEPDPVTGDCLAVHHFWRISKRLVPHLCYVISAERRRGNRVVFALRENNHDEITLQSDPCLAQTWKQTSLSDIASAVTVVTPQMLGAPPPPRSIEDALVGVYRSNFISTRLTVRADGTATLSILDGDRARDGHSGTWTVKEDRLAIRGDVFSEGWGIELEIVDGDPPELIRRLEVEWSPEGSGRPQKILITQHYAREPVPGRTDAGGG